MIFKTAPQSKKEKRKINLVINNPLLKPIEERAKAKGEGAKFYLLCFLHNEFLPDTPLPKYQNRRKEVEQ